MKNIFITGGLGFIGSALVRKLHQDQNNNIIIIDKGTYASNNIARIQFMHMERITLFETDINNQQMIQKLMNFYQPENIYHLAAESHVDNSISGPKVFIYSNILGTFNLLEQCRKYLIKFPEKKQTFRFLYVSTDEVYGDLTLEQEKFTEQSKLKPSSPYSASKTCGDLLVQSWYRTYGLPLLITHCSNNYGPYQHRQKLIPKAIYNILAMKQIPIYGKGDNIRDWIYVDDHVNGLILVMQKGNIGQVYNIGSNCEKTNIDIINTLCEIMQKKLNLEYDPKLLIKFVDDRLGHDKRYAINNTKIKNLGWKHNTSFKKGLQKTVDWYINNKKELN